ncbi:MAG: MarR family transcriptional regulator [Oscillospiraceae bacterium]|nr:MarR family transcriptional regulator [Oscillospiraceae bacterium]
MEPYDALKLENQLCFPLYAAAREVVKQYHPHLSALDLTYTQYIAMMVFWEDRRLSVKELGQKLFLDSGTLTPLLKSLEQKGLVTRARSREDERVLIAEVTDRGMELRERALAVPAGMAGCIRLEPGEALTLYRLLYKLLGRETAR